MKKGLLIVVSGPSGVGKGSLLRKVLSDKDLNLTYSVSFTTRKKRPHEVDGIDYYFVSESTFDEYIKNDGFLEYNRFVGHSYGTPKKEVEENRLKGKNVVLEIDVNGAHQVMSKLKGDPGLVTIFILPPSYEDLEKRLIERSTEKGLVLYNRLAHAKKEMALASDYDHTVINASLEQCAYDICAIISSYVNRAELTRENH